MWFVWLFKLTACLPKYSGRQIKDQSHTAGNSLEIPNMGNRSCQLDMSHTLSTNAGFGYFNATTIADNALIANLLILTTMTLPVLLGSKDLLTEQTVPLGLQGSVVDGLRLRYLTVGPLEDLLR